jgi:hypothetical protein
LETVISERGFGGVFGRILRRAKSVCGQKGLSEAAREERSLDKKGLPDCDPGAEIAVAKALDWLCLAQDSSGSRDGGVAHSYSLLEGWKTSYPETTGYIVPTMLSCAGIVPDREARARAQRMLDWLVSIQLDQGGFQGGALGWEPVVPVTFNTGQILLGLASGVAEFGDRYRASMRAAADWLVETQESDGCWRRYCSPFLAPGERCYETHVAWGLFESARMDPGRSYAEAALANVRWAMKHQYANGWLEKNCLNDPAQPLTHTIGYALRGFLEAYRFSRDPQCLETGVKMADGLLRAIGKEGFLPGRLNRDWVGTVSWSCLTGTAQIAACWLLLFRFTGRREYLSAALSANAYVRRTMKVTGRIETQGAIKGCFPVNGGYGAYEYLNWACKFFLDANLMELELAKDVHVAV